MPKFKYKAKKGVKEIVNGVLSANSELDAVNKLSNQNLFPIEVVPVSVKTSSTVPVSDGKKPSAKPYKKPFFKKFYKKKPGFKDLFLFTQKLATLTKAKVGLLTSLRMLSEQADNPSFKDIICDIHGAVKEGASFSDTLRKYNEVFSPLYISLVKSGEVSGKMDEGLKQLMSLMQMKNSLRSKVLGALIYPFILLIVGLMSIFVIINFVIPRMGTIFEQIGADLPLATKIILKLSAVSTKYWIWAAIALAAFVGLLMMRKGAKVFITFFNKVISKLPVLRRLVENQQLANFSKSFSLLIRSGIPILEALEVSSSTVSDQGMRKKLKDVAKRIKEGEEMSKSMAGFKSLPNFFIEMIAVGEESGRLDEVLDEVAASYSQQIEADIGIITSILEPVLILGLGVVLGGIVIAVLLPIFQVTQMIR